MKNLSILAWWLLLLFALQASSLVLDRSHHLFFGQIGIQIIKLCYIGFGSVLFLRYLSFKAQKSYEQMVESFNRAAGKEFVPNNQPKITWLNPILNIVLVILSSIDFTVVFLWREPTYRISIILDLIIWILGLRWVARTYWLKSQGKREKIKAFLDDSRSKMATGQNPTPDIESKSRAKWPFNSMAFLSLLVAILISLWRWNHASQTYKIDDLKACMENEIRKAGDRFYQSGRLDSAFSEESCTQEKSKEISFRLVLNNGEVYLSGIEKDQVDFFGDGKPGNEALVVDLSGRFRDSWVSKNLP